MWDREHQSRSRCSSNTPRRDEEGMGVRPAPATTKVLGEARAFLTRAGICESSSKLCFNCFPCARLCTAIGAAVAASEAAHTALAFGHRGGDQRGRRKREDLARVFLEKFGVTRSFPALLCSWESPSPSQTFALRCSLPVLGSAASPSCFLLRTRSSSSLVSASQRLPCQALFHKHFHESSALVS